ncbi:MAG: hypothetical protein CFE23_11985 [Flavobacterium sp. BFFFF1]|uniref:hypothetical protein n=1 Tax=unclassified Flavobacterium TaxID=196869 RepID=UPI000BC9B893|nr:MULTISPECIES: hypothetical protein [unclassified Flavobacterium]OYU79841.1 MAG: hypothetical protein CFE23_11985 [Flavobacterium sp. BFFFF1]
MKLLKSFAVCLFLVLATQNTVAQTYRFKATSFSLVEKNEDGTWGKWTEPEESTVVITLDGKKDRIVIGSKELQVYKIMSYGEKIVSGDDETIPLNCMMLDGRACTILIITRKSQGNRKQFYVNFEDVKFVYNVYVN